MPEPRSTSDGAPDVQHWRDYEQFASYEDGDAFVICDREEPQAWIRSEATVDVRQ